MLLADVARDGIADTAERARPRDLCYKARGARLVLTAGLVRTSAGVTPPARWSRLCLIESSGVLALFLPSGPREGREGLKSDDTDGTQFGRD
jgi:hypothetical protein